jgi:hypothetical protein
MVIYCFKSCSNCELADRINTLQALFIYIIQHIKIQLVPRSKHSFKTQSVNNKTK